MKTIARSLFAGAMIMTASLMMASCHKGGKSERKADAADSLAIGWKKVNPVDIEMKPIGAFAQDWMALAMGNSKSYNSMTISWGSIGELWNKPVVIVYVSSDRHSKKLMDAANYFTVSSFPDEKEYKDALVYIGSHSQSDEPDKTANAGLKVEFTELGNPRFTDASRVFECKKIYSEEFKRDRLPQDVKERYYSEMGLHTIYIGEIVNVYEKNLPQVLEQSDSLSQKRSRK